MSTIDRGKAAKMGQEVVEIIQKGWYKLPDGSPVQVQEKIAAAVAGTQCYPPDAILPTFSNNSADTIFEVINETTLNAARRFVAAGYNPVALNFASAKNPGGGFLGGARAQEESLCRSSGLYACLKNDDMYRRHAPTRGGFYTNSAIYSPAVPVFREDTTGEWIEPYLCAFVTAPAVNAGTYLKEGKGRQDDVMHEMKNRIHKVLTIMVGHGHNVAVLGAWGCGVFRNQPELIAELFRNAFQTRFVGVFTRVVFAVLDSSQERRFIGPFEQRFQS
jgi:uncharacterized protein (TIGR02452 family)